MNTDYLREFVVFAGHMNFTTAAKTLDMSQPTLSRHISELERHYGCELVDRSAALLRLTHCGKTLLEQAPELIALENLVAENMGRARQEPYGTLVIERYRKSPLIQGFLSSVVGALKSNYPGFTSTRLALRPGDTAGDAVLRGDLDIGVVACTTDREPACPVQAREGFGAWELKRHRERICFVVSAANPLAQRDSLCISDLDSCRFVYPLNPEFGRCLPDVTQLFEARGMRLRSRPHELDEVEELGLMDIGPDEMFIVVESAANSPDSFYLSNPKLAVIPCADEIWVTRFLIWDARKENPVRDAFLTHVRANESA